MTEQTLAVREAAQIVQRGGFDDEHLALLKRTLSDLKPPITTDELTLYKQVIQYTGLNPFNREIYALRIDGRLTIWTGIDGHRRIAQASPRFRGLAGPEWCGADGVWRDVWLEDHAPAACRVGVYLPGRQEPTWGIAYYKNYKSRVSATWRSQPEQMLAVRAESFALRKCFSRELAGVALPDDDRPGYVDADGVIDEGHPTRALAPRRRSAADFSDEPIPTTLEPDQMTPFEQEQPPAVAPVSAEVALARDVATAEADAAIAQVEQANHPVSEATKLACAAFVDEVKAANPKLRIALPPEAEGEGAWRRWLEEKRQNWLNSPHNPANQQTAV